MSSLPAEEEVAEKAAEAPEGEAAEDESLLLNAALACCSLAGDKLCFMGSVTAGVVRAIVSVSGCP